MSECEYCGQPVEFPLPIHPKCAGLWLEKFHREEPTDEEWANRRESFAEELRAYGELEAEIIA